jgi:hypothetical protein
MDNVGIFYDQLEHLAAILVYLDHATRATWLIVVQYFSIALVL